MSHFYRMSIIASKRAFYYYELMLRIFIFEHTSQTHGVIAVFSSGRGDTSRVQDLKRSAQRVDCVERFAVPCVSQNILSYLIFVLAIHRIFHF